MFELTIFLMFGEPTGHADPLTRADVVGYFTTREICHQALWEWYEHDRLPAGTERPWFQFMPGDCVPVAAPPSIG